MSEMLLQAFLRGGRTPEDLTNTLAIRVKRHPTFGSLVHFLYNDYDSPLGDPMVQECRGVILDESDNWRVVARPFDKFFNWGQVHCAPIDWSTARVQEKVDGTLCYLYHYDDRWHVATKGMPNAGGPVGRLHEETDANLTFADLFWQTWESLGLPPPDGALVPSLTYCFELWTSANCIQVRYAAPRLVLLATRERETGAWVDDAEWFGARVAEFPLRTIEEIEASLSTISPFAAEGYVVVDGANRRAKVKSPQYVAMAHAREGATPKWFLDVVRRGETPEVVTYFPDLAPQFEAVRDRYDALCASIDSEYDAIKDIVTQKDFAAQALKSKWFGVLFSRRKSGTTTREVLSGWMIGKLADGLGIGGNSIDAAPAAAGDDQ